MLLKYTHGPLVGKGGKGKGNLIRVNGKFKFFCLKIITIFAE